MANYTAYIDDSGTKEYASSAALYSKAGGVSRYFCFGALLVEANEGSSLADRIAEAKRRTFGTADVEIKSNWLRRPKERGLRYLQPHGLVDSQLTDFVEEYYGIVGAAKCVAVAVVVHKVHMQSRYPQPWYAPTAAYETLMQRLVQEVRHPHALSVTIDDMTGATPAGNQYKKNLSAHHARLRAKGSQLQPSLSFQSLRHDLRFVNSASSHLVQVADILAYNVYRQFVDHGEAWETANPVLPTYDWFEKIGRLFRKDENGRIQGYGVVKFPMVKRIPWTVSS